MIPASTCPNADHLAAMLDESLLPEDQRAVQEHVNTCAACQQRVEALIQQGGAGDLSFSALGEVLDDATVLHRSGSENAPTRPSSNGTGGRTAALDADDLPLDFLAPPDDPEHLGKLDHYEILEVVGRGGLGVVLKGYDTRLKRIVAIKVPLSQFAANAAARKRFAREAEAAAAVSHDHVVTIHAVEPDRMPPYLVMEYVDGVSLQQKLDTSGPLELREILRIGMQAARGLAAAHEQGLVHRDIKPANILLENGVQRVKLTDFGLARAVDDVGMTQTGTVAGTPQYMSPEQAHGEQVDHRSDLFSLGGVLYAMCTGRAPFRAESTMAVLKRVCDDTPKPIRKVNPEVPEWLCEIVEKLLEKGPQDRFQSAAGVADLLNRHLAHLQQPEANPQPARLAPVSRQVEKITQRRLKVVHHILVILGCFSVGWFFIALLAPSLGPVGPGFRIPAMLLSFIVGMLALWGASCVAARHSRGWAIASCLALMLPLSPVWLIALPLGLVALGTLMRRDVRSAFELRHQPEPVCGERDGKTELSEEGTVSGWRERKRPFWIDFAIAALVILCVVGVFAGLNEFGGLRQTIERLAGMTGRITLEVGGPHVEVEYDGQKVAITDSGRTTLFVPPGDYEIESLVRGEAISITWHDIGRGVHHTVEIPDRADAVRVRGPLGAQEKAERFLRAAQFESGLDDELYTVTRDGELLRVRVNKGTIETHVVRRLGAPYSEVEGLALGADGALYAAVNFGASPAQLHRIDQQTGDATLVGAMQHAQVDGLTFDSAGVLLGVVSKYGGGRQGQLIEIDPATGASRALSGDLGLEDLDSLVIDANGRLLTTDGIGLDDAFYRLDRQGAGPATRSAPTPPVAADRDVEGLTLASDGYLYGVTNPLRESGNASYLLRIDPETFEYHNLGSLGFGAMSIVAVPRGNSNTPRDSVVVQVHEVGRLEGHTRRPMDLLFLNDGVHAISGGNDETIRMWDVESGAFIRSFTDDAMQAVACLAVSPDEQFLVSGHHAGMLRVWDLASGDVLHRIEAHGQSPFDVAFLPGMNQFVSGGYDFQIRLWDAVTGDEIAKAGPLDGAHCLAVSPDGRVLLGRYDKLEFLQFPGGDVVQSLPGHEGGVSDVAISRDGTLAASASDRGSVHLWDLRSGERLARLEGHSGHVETVAITPDARYVISGGWDRTLRVWDVQTYGEVARATTEKRVSLELAVSPDSRNVLTGGGEWWDGAQWIPEEDYDIRLWQLPDVPTTPVGSSNVFELAESDRLDGHTDGINDVLVLSDGVSAISSAIDSSIRFWNLAEGKEVHRIPCTTADAVVLAVSPDESLLASGHSRGAICVWDLETHERLARFDGPAHQIRSVTFVPHSTLIASITIEAGLSLWDYVAEKETARYAALANANELVAAPDGEHLLLGLFNGRVVEVRIADGRVVTEYRGHQGSVTSLAYSPDRRFIAAGSGANGDGSISIWDTQTHELIQRLTGHDDVVQDLVYTPDNRYLVSGSHDRTLRVWDGAHGKELARAVVNNHVVHHIAVSPDARTIITGGGSYWNLRETVREFDYALRVWRLEDKPAPSVAGGPVEIARSSHVFTGTLATGDANVFALAFTKNGDRAVTGQFGGKLVLWDVAQGSPHHSFEGHSGTVHAVTVSPDEQWLASGGEDSVIRLWNLSTGEPVKEIPGHTGRVMSLAFRDQGRELISMGCDFTDHEDNTIRIWDVETGEERGRITGDLKYPADLALAPDGSWAAVSDAASGRVGLWDLASRSARHFFGGFATTPVSVALSSDGALLAAGYNAKQQVDGKWDDPDNAVVRLWNVDSGLLMHELRGHSGSILSVQFSPDDRYILSLGSDQHDEHGKFILSSDHTARVWDVATGKELVRFQIDRANVARWLPNGQSICTGVRIWEVPGRVRTRDVNAAAGGTRPRTTVTRVRSFGNVHEYIWHNVAVSFDGRKALSVSTAPATVQDLETGRAIWRQPGRFNAGAFLPDGRVLLGTAHQEDDPANRLVMCDAATGRELYQLEAGNGQVTGVAVTADGRLAASSHEQWWGPDDLRDYAVRVWDLETQSPVGFEIRGHRNSVMAVAISADGSRVASASRDTTVRVWAWTPDARSWDETHQFRATGTEAFSVALSQDGRYLVASHGPAYEATRGAQFDDPDHCVAVLWDLDTGDEAQRFVGHHGCINTVAISSDGRLVATGSGGQYVGDPLPDGGPKTTSDNSVRLWDARTGRELARLPHRTSVRSARFSPDGRELLTGEFGVFHLWRLPEDLTRESPPAAPDAPGAAEASKPRQLLVSSDRGGNLDIYLIDEAGGGWTNLTNHPAEDTGPAWSPDGTQIAFSSTRGGNYDVWVMDADGGNPRRLTDFPGIDRVPAWSPDGRKIAFVRHVSGDDDWEVFVMNADGSDAANFSDHPFREADPAWSPDGERLALSVGALGETSLYLMNADGSGAHRLSGRNGSFVYPAWSPDGEQIVFTAHPDGSRDLELFVINADGSGERQLTAMGGMNTYAAWSPDGGTIAFQHRKPDTAGAGATVYLISPNGTDLTAITGAEAPSRYGGGRPAWRPKIETSDSSALREQADGSPP